MQEENMELQIRYRQYWNKVFENRKYSPIFCNASNRENCMQRNIGFTIDNDLASRFLQEVKHNALISSIYGISMLAVLMHRFSGCEDIYIVMPAPSEQENIIVIDITIQQEMTFRELLNYTKGKLSEAVRHKNYIVGEKYKDYMNADEGKPVPSLFVIFDNNESYFDLFKDYINGFAVLLDSSNNALEGIIQYDANMYDEEKAKQVIDQYNQIFRQVLENKEFVIYSEKITDYPDNQPADSNSGAKEDDDLILPPRTLMEEKLVKIWCRVLEIDNIGINQDFFKIGGHSLKAVLLEVEMTKENIAAEYEDIYTYRTIKEYAENLERKGIVYAEGD